MGGFSDYWENEILDHIFSKGNYTPPTIYVGLSTADPADDGSGLSEPSDNGYARVATSSSDWNVASGGAVTNANDIIFPKATGSWGTISHFALFDAATGGNMLAHGSLSEPIEINSPNMAKIATGSISVTLN